jgi:hypothetical protein
MEEGIEKTPNEATRKTTMDPRKIRRKAFLYRDGLWPGSGCCEERKIVRLPLQ